MCEPSQRAENYHLDCSKKNFFFLRSCSITPKSKEISIGKHRHRQRVTWDAKIDLRGNPWTVSLLYDPSFYCLFLRAMSTSNLVMCRAKHYWWRSWHVITETSSRVCVCACARAFFSIFNHGSSLRLTDISRDLESCCVFNWKFTDIFILKPNVTCPKRERW